MGLGTLERRDQKEAGFSGAAAYLKAVVILKVPGKHTMLTSTVFPQKGKC